MISLGTILRNVALPALVSAIALIVARAVGRRDEGTAGGPWGVALALGAGYVAGHLAIAWPSWPPIDVTDRIPFLVLAATVLGVLDATWPAPAWVSWENRLLLSGMTVVALLGPTIQETWATREELLRLAGLAGVIVLIWANLDLLAARLEGSAIVLPLLILAGGVGAVLLLSGLLMGLRFGVVWSSALAACWLACWRGPRLSLARGGVPIAVVLLSGLVLYGGIYAEMPRPSALLLALAPATLWIARLGPVRRRRPWLVTLAAAVAMLVPVAVAVGLAVAAMPAEEY